MTKTKRYFWLKLKEDFFNQKEIKLLRKIAGGDTYTIIYLKLLLLSLKNNGKIYFDGLTDEFAEEIALEIDESVENVTVTLQFLEKKGLIAYDNDHNDEFELTNIASMIGSETDKASMMRRKRAREKEEKLLSNGNDVTKELPHRYTEKEIEKELEIEKEKSKRKTLSSRPLSFDTYENLNFGFLDPLSMQKLFAWIDDFGDEGDVIVSKALEVAASKDKRSLNYAIGILKNWHQMNFKTLDSINSHIKSKDLSNGMTTLSPEEEQRRIAVNERRLKEWFGGDDIEIINE